VQQAVAQLAMAPISAWRSCFQEFRDIAPNSGLKGNTVTGDQLEAAASAEATPKSFASRQA